MSSGAVAKGETHLEGVGLQVVLLGRPQGGQELDPQPAFGVFPWTRVKVF